MAGCTPTLKFFLILIKPGGAIPFQSSVNKIRETLKSIAMISTKFNLKHILPVLIISATTILFSCQKDNSVNSEPVADEEAVTISEENAAADAEYEETAEIGFSAGADLEMAASTGSGNFGAGVHA